MPLYAIIATRTVKFYQNASTEIEASNEQVALNAAREEIGDLVWFETDVDPGLVTFSIREIKASEGG